MKQKTKKFERKYSQNVHRFRTHSELFNAISGGGIRLNTISEFWGPYRSGKTTAAYQLAQNALYDFGDDGRVLILDSEVSSDSNRLEKIYDLHPCNGEIEVLKKDPRVFLYYTAVIEEAFDLAINFIEQAKRDGTPTLIIVDSIATLKARKDVEAHDKALETGGAENKYSAGMMSQVRTLSDKLTDVMRHLPNSNSSVILINQAIINMDSYMKEYKSKGGSLKPLATR